MKKAQVQSQIFIFILVLIVISFTIVFGYRAIRNLSEQSEQTTMILFEQEMARKIRSGMNYGYVDYINLELPRKYDTVCFVGLSYDQTSINQQQYPLIYSSVTAGAKDNVFIGRNAERSFEIERMDVDGNFFCIENNIGIIRLKTEGKGDRTLISQVD